MSNNIEGAVEWRPDWEGEQRAHFEKMRAALARDISVMRTVRKAMGLSQVETAEILEMTQSNVSKLERGEPTLAVIHRLVEAKGGKVSLHVTSADGEEVAIAL